MKMCLKRVHLETGCHCFRGSLTATNCSPLCTCTYMYMGPPRYCIVLFQHRLTWLGQSPCLPLPRHLPHPLLPPALLLLLPLLLLLNPFYLINRFCLLSQLRLPLRLNAKRTVHPKTKRCCARCKNFRRRRLNFNKSRKSNSQRSVVQVKGQ